MKKKIIITVLALFIVIVAAGSFAGKTLLFNDDLKILNYYTVRAYTGDRITINMHVTVDGKPVETVSDKRNMRLDFNGSYTELKDRAASYDTYEYPMIINSRDRGIPLNITVRHWNWWEIIESDLYIDIDTDSNTYTTHEEYKYTAESQSIPVYYYIKHESSPEETFGGIESIDISAGYRG